ncbi:MAG TPA: Glu/Leu/Phe/Val dehydrogenase [Clostridia bacterium]|nr:Glu/Leu/Phe/Val dehydrogenase [Clostridia bacterium]
MVKAGHERVVFCHDERTSLSAIIAIHSTVLGPALGGCRWWPYRNEDDALDDVLRLSKAMTYKNAAAGLDLGGGKSVIIGDPAGRRHPDMLRSFAECVEALGGRYITAEDVGMSLEALEEIGRYTKYVCGLPHGSGSPSPATAYGVYVGMKVCSEEVFGSPDLSGRTVAIQGLGHVGYSLARRLREDGTKVIACDIASFRAAKAAEELDVTCVPPEDIFSVKCDIFAPCALGGAINPDTVKKLRCSVVAGSANNQLSEPDMAWVLMERGILYAPDFLINAGGVINIADEIEHGSYSRERAFRRVESIAQRLRQVFRISRERNIPTADAALMLADERLRAKRDSTE